MNRSDLNRLDGITKRYVDEQIGLIISTPGATGATGSTGPTGPTGSTGPTWDGGTVSNPSYFTAGLSANTLSVSGTAIASSIGIGTTPSTHKLEVVSNTIGAELLAKFSASDADGYIAIENGTSGINTYIPLIRAVQPTSTNTSLFINAQGVDSGSNPAIILDARKFGATTLSTQPLFQIRNYTTPALHILANGNTGINNTNAGTRLDVNGDFASRMTSPAQITADQNDYSTSGFTNWRLSTDASRTITGFANGSDGKTLTIFNVGSFDIVLAHQSTSSTNINRMILGNAAASITILPNDSVTLCYDATTTRWRLISKSF